MPHFHHSADNTFCFAIGLWSSNTCKLLPDAIVTTRFDKRLIGYRALFVGGLVLAGATGTQSFAGTCVETGGGGSGVWTCSGTFVPAEFPNTFNVPAANTLILDASVDASMLDSNGFILRNTSGAAADMSLELQAGAIIRHNDGTRLRDPLLVFNGEDGTLSALISGQVISDERGLGVRSTNNTSVAADNFIRIAETGSIRSNQTAIWQVVRGIGNMRIDVEGTLFTTQVRGIHTTQGNVDNPHDIVINVAETGTVESHQQAIYIGTNGTGVARVDVAGDVIGGWNMADIGGANSNFGPTAGIIIQAEAAGSEISIRDTGTLSSLNDMAIMDDDDNRNTSVQAPMQIINDGTITGYMLLGGGDDQFTNNSTNAWNIRSFADTDGDLVRDTESVAVSDFGAGTDTFTNAATGTVRLLTVSDQTSFTSGTDDDTAPATVDATGEYTVAFGMAKSIADEGVEQGHLLNLETFEHAGVITLADAETGGVAPVTGDVLVITGSDTAGTDGGGQFTANGGELRLDTVLNAGGTDSDSDVLVLDNTALGSGPVTLSITNALLGAGASTDTNNNGLLDDGEGILVIEVLGDSATDAFTMASIRDGDFEYTLEQNLNDGNWYLVSRFSPPAAIPTSGASSQTLLVILLAALGSLAVARRKWLTRS
ncbi:hypothetical protein [Ostreibacterium oceani]